MIPLFWGGGDELSRKDIQMDIQIQLKVLSQR